MKPKTSKAIKKVASVATTALVQRTNPYGFLPLLIPIAAVAGGAMLLGRTSTAASGVGDIFSVPVFIGAGAGYVVGAATKADDKTRIAYAVLGLGLGWAVQKYVVSPKEEAVAEAKYEADWSWYKPWTW